MSDVLMPWWTPWVLLVLMAGCLFLSAWFDRYSKARLREATDYWRRSQELWDAIDAKPVEEISEDGLRVMERFLADETDQTGSIASDYGQAP